MKENYLFVPNQGCLSVPDVFFISSLWGDIEVKAAAKIAKSPFSDEKVLMKCPEPGCDKWVFGKKTPQGDFCPRHPNVLLK